MGSVLGSHLGRRAAVHPLPHISRETCDDNPGPPCQLRGSEVSLGCESKERTHDENGTGRRKNDVSNGFAGSSCRRVNQRTNHCGKLSLKGRTIAVSCRRCKVWWIAAKQCQPCAFKGPNHGCACVNRVRQRSEGITSAT